MFRKISFIIAIATLGVFLFIVFAAANEKQSLSIPTAALIVSLVIGSLMLCTVCLVYVKYRVLGLSGFVLASFGFILLGLSVWQTVDISTRLGSIKLVAHRAEVAAAKAEAAADRAEASAAKAEASAAKADQG